MSVTISFCEECKPMISLTCDDGATKSTDHDHVAPGILSSQKSLKCLIDPGQRVMLRHELVRIAKLSCTKEREGVRIGVAAGGPNIS